MSALLQRRKLSGVPATVASGGSTTTTHGLTVPVELTISGDPVVRGGHQYYLRVSVYQGVFVKGCAITYR